VPDGSIVALDVSILLGLAGLDMLDGYSSLLRPRQERATDQFRAVVDTNGEGLSSPLDDTVQRACHPLRRQREVRLDAQPFTVEVIQNIRTLLARNRCGSPSKKPFDIKGPSIPALLAKALK
jgi:hypothetical protein